MNTLISANKALDALLLKGNHEIGTDESYVSDQKHYRNVWFECVNEIEDYKKILLDKGIISGTEDTKPDSDNINELTNTLAQMLKNQNESTAKLLKNSSGSGSKPYQPFFYI